MPTVSSIAIILIAVAASVASAGTVAVPTVSESPYSDTESVTNAAVRASLIQRVRTFSGDISLFATPSLGWENGAWFIDAPTNRIASAVLEGATRRSLSFSVRVSAEGAPTRFSISAADDDFAALTNAPPAWLFSRDWNAVRVTVNGVDDTAESVGIRLDNDPWLFIAR